MPIERLLRIAPHIREREADCVITRRELGRYKMAETVPSRAEVNEWLIKKHVVGPERPALSIVKDVEAGLKQSDRRMQFKFKLEMQNGSGECRLTVQRPDTV